MNYPRRKPPYCHGSGSDLRVSFAMWTWQFERIGPRGGLQKSIFGKRNWMPHEQPKVCPQCGFVFSFIGCNRLHLSKCTGTQMIAIENGIEYSVMDITPPISSP